MVKTLRSTVNFNTDLKGKPFRSILDDILDEKFAFFGMNPSDETGEYRTGVGIRDSRIEMRSNGSRGEANTARQIRIAENREIGTLNDRHADYISEVRFLQAIHRKLKLRLEQWSRIAKPGYARDTISETIRTNGETKQRYDADAEKIPSLNVELNNTRSRYESALRGRDLAAEDSLLVRLCDVRSQICLAKGRGKVIQEECQRLRSENQKLMNDIASQRQIFDRETQERYSYERRARPLLEECEELLRKCKLGSSRILEETTTIPGYSFDDIERDRMHFREGIEASMGDIRRQYEILASTVTSEMEQWYKEQMIGIDIKQREDASSYKKKLADLRAELIDVRTKLAHLEERNRLLTSLIGDFEDAREQEQRITDSCIKEEENNIKQLIERYNELISAPSARDERYSIATLRTEIMRYRELLDGVGPRSNRDISTILKSAFEKMDSRIVIRSTATRDGGTGIGTGVVSLPQVGGGVTTYVSGSGGGTTYVPHGSGSTTQIGGEKTSQTQVSSGDGTTYAPYGSGTTTQLGPGVTSQTQVGRVSTTFGTYGSGPTAHIGAGVTSQSYANGGATSHSQVGDGVSSQAQIGGEAASQPYSGGGVTPQTYIGGGTISHTHIGTGVASHSRTTSGHSQIGSGAGVLPHIGQEVAQSDITPDGSAWSGRRYSWTERKQPTTVVSSVDYMLRGERESTPRYGGDHHEYTMQRSAQGNVTIGKVANDGSSVIIENTSMDIDQHIGEWTLRSTSSTLRQVSYTFPRGFILPPQSTVQVFARGKGVHDPPRSVVCETEPTFATGDDLDIYLYDNNGQERARLTQRSFFRNGATHSTF